ncbi:MAG TPA: hypothetical protein VGI03_03145 [Verrucomicrobiae bacterium]|jgi:hypothetical protein
MKFFLERGRLSAFGFSIPQSLGAVVFFWVAIFSPVVGRAGVQFPMLVSTRSNSGEFAVMSANQVSPLADSLMVKTNAQLVRLQPALLAVSAEHIKDSMDQRLGIAPSKWNGQIYLALRPAQSPDENVTIMSSRFNGAWMYRVDLPDVISRVRLIRALSGAVLLEYANQAAGEHSAEIPRWLAEGLSQELLEDVSPEIVSLSPGKFVNGYPEDRLVKNDFGLNPLSHTREVLKGSTPLTFDELSWPTDAQLSGGDGGVYGASAQLFVADLLTLRDGAANLRVMLQSLPKFYNWQLAFRSAFRNDFHTPVDLEKWWALQTVDFVSRDTDLQWSPRISREKLDEILAVPIDYRTGSNNLPLHAEISLQRLISNFDSQHQAEILQEKVRELNLAQIEMAPQYAALNGQYRQILSDYLNENPRATVSHWVKHAPQRTRPGKVLEKLNILDAQRRALENALDGAAQPILTEANSRL